MEYALDLSKPVSLYIHIPFCTTKCGYCAFYSVPAKATCNEEKERFYELLLAQLNSLVDYIKKPFYTIFIGGGNPALLGFDRLKNLIITATKYGQCKECTVEINPEHVNKNMEILFPLVNRVSVGLQSFSTSALKVLERNATRETNLNALKLLSSFRERYGITFNGDLITCIPSHGLEGTLSDIETLSSFSPDHISLYALTFEEGTKLVQNTKPLDDEEQEVILKAAWEKLKSLGYEQYEVSNFAKDGHYSLHNQVYWDLGQYIGLGPSAESSVGYSHLISSREAETLTQYLKDQSFHSVALNDSEAMEEYFLAKLRTKKAVSYTHLTLPTTDVV